MTFQEWENKYTGLRNRGAITKFKETKKISIDIGRLHLEHGTLAVYYHEAKKFQDKLDCVLDLMEVTDYYICARANSRIYLAPIEGVVK